MQKFKYRFANIFGIALLLLITTGVNAQNCRVTSLTINTGYDPQTGTPVATGTPDPRWDVTALSADLWAIVAPVSMPYAAFAVPAVGTWATNTNSEWINVINSNTYATSSTLFYQATFTRTFTTCIDDNIRFNIDIANDNYCPQIRVDGIPVPLGTPFSQPPGQPPANYNTFTTIPSFAIFLGAGVHTIEVDVVNFAVTSSNNPSGLNIVGSVSSATNTASLVRESADCERFDCNTCDASFTYTISSNNPYEATFTALAPLPGTSFIWLVNGNIVGGGSPFNYNFSSPGYYEVCLMASNKETGEECIRCIYICIAENRDPPKKSINPSNETNKINNITPEHFKVFPNPAGNSINIELMKEKSGNVQLKIYDLTGRLVIEQENYTGKGIQKLQIDTRKLAQGAYIFKLNDGENEYKQTIIKE